MTFTITKDGLPQSLKIQSVTKVNDFRGENVETLHFVKIDDNRGTYRRSHKGAWESHADQGWKPVHRSHELETLFQSYIKAFPHLTYIDLWPKSQEEEKSARLEALGTLAVLKYEAMQDIYAYFNLYGLFGKKEQEKDRALYKVEIADLRRKASLADASLNKALKAYKEQSKI